MKWKQRIKINLKKRLLEDSLRFRTVLESGSGRFVIYNKQKYCNFSCNDYLGLSHHPSVVRAWQLGAERYGVGSSSSGHINGYTTAHYQFEEELASWMGYPRALLFNSGFAANQAVITALASKDDCIIADRLSHASLLEAASFSPAKLRRFPHNDTKSLLSLLQEPCAGQLLVVTEGIFSMDGDSAPLGDFHIATKKTNSWLMVDDAHGFGVIGSKGRGSCTEQKIAPELLVVTFGKAAGVGGAALLCSEDVANYLVQCAKHLIYSTSMPPAQAVALLASLNIIRGEEGEERRQKLTENIYQFRNGVTSLHVSLSESNCAIQPLIIGDNTRTITLAKFLRKKKIWAVAIRPPTVPQSTARLRLTLSAVHETSDIVSLLEALHDASE